MKAASVFRGAPVAVNLQVPAPSSQVKSQSFPVIQGASLVPTSRDHAGGEEQAYSQPQLLSHVGEDAPPCSSSSLPDIPRHLKPAGRAVSYEFGPDEGTGGYPPAEDGFLARCLSTLSRLSRGHPPCIRQSMTCLPPHACPVREDHGSTSPSSGELYLYLGSPRRRACVTGSGHLDD